MTGSTDPAAYRAPGDAGHASDAGATAQGAVDQAQQKVGQVADQVQEKAGQAADQARQQATARLADQKERATGGLGTVAHAMRQTGDTLREQDQDAVAGYADQAADQVERLADYLRGRNVLQLLGDVEGFARRQPALFLGGAFALGVLGARFLKSSGQPEDTAPRYPAAPGGRRTGYRATPYAPPYGAPADMAGRAWPAAGEPATAGPSAITGGSAPMPTTPDWERDADTPLLRGGHDAGT